MFTIPGDLNPGGFTLSFSEDRGLLSTNDLYIDDIAVVEKLDLLIPQPSFPLDMSDGIESLRHRRHELGRFRLTILAGGLERALKERLQTSGLFTLWAIAFEEDHLSVLLTEGATDGYAFSLRLLPTPTETGFNLLIDSPTAYGPSTRNLLDTAASAVEALFGIRPQGLHILLPNLVHSALIRVLPDRGWRLPNDTEKQLTDVRISADRIVFQYTHPDLAVATDASDRKQRSEKLETLKTKEESRITEIGDNFVTAGNLEDARRFYTKLLDRDPDAAFAAARVAMLDVVHADTRETAVSLIENALSYAPKRRDLNAVLLHGAAIFKDAEKEKKALETILDHGNSCERMAAGVRLGRMLLDDAPETAVSILERVANIRRNDKTALDALMHAVVVVKDLERLSRLIPRRIAAETTPEGRAEAHAFVGGILLTLNEVHDAAVHFEKAVLADPKNLAAAWGQAEALCLLGDTTRAIERFESLTTRLHALGDKRGASNAAARLADIWLEKNELSLAVQRLVESIESAPDRPDRRLRLAEVWMNTDRPEASAMEIETALKLLGETPNAALEASALVTLSGIYLYDLNDLEAARTTARRGIQRTPSVEGCKDILRRVLERKGHAQDAAGQFDTPGDVLETAHDFRDLGETRTAIQMLEKGVTQFPENMEIADAIIELCRQDGAREQLYLSLIERIETVGSPRRRAEMEVELGNLCLTDKENPSAAICWFRSALEKVPSRDAETGIAAAAKMLQGQAEQLLADGNAEAADMIFAAVQEDTGGTDAYADRLANAEAALAGGDLTTAAMLSAALSLAPRETRIRAAIVTAGVLAAEGRTERAVQLLEQAVSGQVDSGKRLLYIGAVKINATHLADPEAAAEFLQRVVKSNPKDEEADTALMELLSLGADRVRLAEYLAVKRTPFNQERFRRAAELFKESGLNERAAVVLETLYRETDAIDDLFILAELLRKIGNHEVLIGMLEERRNEDPRVDEMLKRDLAVYADLLKYRSIDADEPYPQNGLVTIDPERATPNTSGLLLPISTDAPLPELSADDKSLDEKLSSAFNRLRIK